MTNEEFEVLNKLVEAHSEFVKLPRQHPNDLIEWVSKLHDLQRIIMARKAVREVPCFTNSNDPYILFEIKEKLPM